MRGRRQSRGPGRLQRPRPGVGRLRLAPTEGADRGRLASPRLPGARLTRRRPRGFRELLPPAPRPAPRPRPRVGPGVLLPRPTQPLLTRKAPAGRRAAPPPSPPRPPAAPPLPPRSRAGRGREGRRCACAARAAQRRKLRPSSEPRPRRPATRRPLLGRTDSSARLSRVPCRVLRASPP